MKNHSVTSVSSPVDKVQHTPQQQAWTAIEQALAERDKLKAINAELLEALQECINWIADNDEGGTGVAIRGRATILKATQ